MTDTKWAFDRNKFWSLMIGWYEKQDEEERLDQENEVSEFIQSACESYAKADVKKFAEEVRPDWYGHHNDCRKTMDDRINDALKKRGI